MRFIVVHYDEIRKSVNLLLTRYKAFLGAGVYSYATKKKTPPRGLQRV